ncbi:hypothetical protein [Paenibacillus lactis]|uniref:Uncharacterized protein n=1 Tax=Paenibacillus lactis 154 TaxID=743719 RepID=G4HMI2_9BACL|nr:hypothetical protein [Paenibacillus lactis]EHB54509.1 hypothetical protein PaelaDRAFT_5258 [Paenibacillus lactis 154]
MNKKLIILLSTALLVGGGAYTYNAFAAEKTGYDIQNEDAREIVETTTPDDTVNNRITFQDISTIPEDEIHIPLNLAKQTATLSYSEVNQNPIVDLVGAYSTNNGVGFEIVANYNLSSGGAVDLIQSASNITQQEAINYYTSGIYSDANINVSNINGLPAILVEGQHRKVIHIISNDYVYSVLTVFDEVSIDYLLEVAKQINLKI